MSYSRRPVGLYFWVLGVYIFLYAPILTVILNSFNRSEFLVGWGGFTLHWYTVAWSNPSTLAAAKTSVMVASIVTLVSVVVGTVTALALQRSPRWLRGMLVGMTYARIVMPELVLALAILIFLTRVGLFGGTTRIVIGHSVFISAYVTIIVAARLAGRDPATDEAARDLGATPFRAFMRVTIPDLAPALITASLLAFTFSLDDVVSSFFLGSTNTLPVVILSLVRLHVTPEVNAIGTTLMGATLAAMVLFLIVNWRWSFGGAHDRQRRMQR